MTTNSLTQITVPFHSAELYLVEHNGQPYTPMKTIVEGMGLAWQSQLAKLNANPQRWGVTKIVIPTLGDLQEMVCLPLRKPLAWLTTISPNKVKPELRDTVIMYQNECDDVLWDYWAKGQAINKRHTITAEQQAALHEVVSRRSHGERKIFAEMWARHNRHFKIAKYSQLLAIHFDDAVNYLELMDLKPKALPAPIVEHKAAYHDQHVQFLMWYLPKLAKLIRDDIYPALNLLGSSQAGMLIGLSHEAACHVNLLNMQAIKNGMVTLEHVGDRPVPTLHNYLNA